MVGLSVTAEEVSAMAAYMGIDLTSNEFWLLALARAAAESPVPHPWEELEDENGNPYFTNTRSGKVSRRHPMDAQYLELVNSARKRGAPPENARRTWMAFTDENGTVSYFDFLAGEASLSAPDESQLISELPQHKRPRYDGFRWEATTLEKRAEALKELKELRFETCWAEDNESNDLTFRVDTNSNVGGGLRSRHMTIIFNIRTNQFEVAMDEDGQLVRLHRVPSVTSNFGMPVQCWDLYVGAQLMLLGKRVTLVSASSDTRQWLDLKAKALEKAKDDVLANIKKYTTKPLPTSLVFTRGSHKTNRHGRAEREPAGMALRTCIEKIQALIDELAKHRPSVAAKKTVMLEDFMAQA